MAAKEIWDYLNTTAVAADVIAAGSTLTTPYPQNILGENGEYNQVIHLGDDGSEERIGFSSTAVFYVTLKWVGLSEADACLLYTSPSPRDQRGSRMPSSA